MTVNIAYSGTEDGYLYAYGASWVNAYAATGTSGADTAGNLGRIGEAYWSGAYYAYLLYTSWAYSLVSDETVVAAYLRLSVQNALSPGTYRRAQSQLYDWGATLTTADWVSNWALTAVAVYENIEQATGRLVGAGGDNLVSRLVSGSSPMRVVTRTDNTAAAIQPAQQQDIYIYTSDEAGTADDPALIWLSVATSTHLNVSGAQVRLSTGAWAYITSDGAATPVLTLRYRESGGTTSDVGVVPTGVSSTDFAVANGLQTLALVRDASDNLYILGPNGAATGSLSVRMYAKGAGTTWTARTMRTAALPAHYDAGINNVAAGWHNTGVGGTIVAVCSHGRGRCTPAQSASVAYALVDCTHADTGAGTLLRGSGTAIDQFVPAASGTGWLDLPANECGTGLDLQVPPSAGLRGYAFCWKGDAQPGTNASHSVARYVLASGGASLASVSFSTTRSWSYKSPSGKARVLAISDTVVATVTTDEDTGWGMTVNFLQNTGTSNTWTDLAYVTLDGDVAQLPAASAMAVSAAWDAIYDAIDNKVWVYYVDKANARRILRTSIDCNTYLPTSAEVQLTASLGTGAASVCDSIRVERNARAGDGSVLVTVAVDTSGVKTSDVYVDSFNLAPTAPTLTPVANFDATAAATFSWTFTDPDPSDTQSAFQYDVNTSAGVDVYDTGKMGAAVTYIAAGAVATGNNASLAPAMPAGWAPGDLLVILASIRNSGTGTVAVPAGWTALATSGNASLLGRIARTGDTAPTVTFANGAANADTLAQMAAFRGTDQNIATVVHASQAQLNGSAANVAYPALTVTAAGCAVLYLGWKQDDWTSVAAISGATEISDAGFSTAGDDAAQVWDYVIQTAAASISAGSFTVTGGANAISRGLTVALRPYQAPTTGSFTLPANTIPNSASYQWRVRTYDAAGVVSPWSDYSVFQTSAGGNVTVTTPASDNPAGVVTDDYTIAWSVSGTTQASYRVVVTRTDTSAVLVNTGWVTSTDATYTVAGMLSDVEYQIAVTVRNAGAVESGTGTRKITPSFATPETPTVVPTAVDTSGYVLLTVTNPDPGAPALGTTPETFETGVTGFDATGCAFTRSSTVAYAGTYSGKMVVSGTPTSAYVRPTTATAVAVTAGTRYTVSYWGYSAAGYASLMDAIDWLDSDSSYLATAASSQTAIPAATWTLRTFTATAPAGAAYAKFGPTLGSNPPTNETLYIDELLLATASDKPTPVGNQIHRRRADGQGDTVVVATEVEVAADGTYRDYAAASGVAWEYQARAVATTGWTDSAWATVTPRLLGVWVHDPLDPDGSAIQLLYGKSARSTAIDSTQTALQFAGRIYPVVEHGEQRSDTFSVGAVIPHGATWQADVEAFEELVTSRRTLYYRDNRGRSAWCVLSGYNASDADEGTSVSFTVTRVDWTETVL